MNIYIIAMASAVVIAFVVLLVVVSIEKCEKKKKWNHSRNYKGKVFVREGMDIKEQLIGKGKGKYFSGKPEDQPTCLADSAWKPCQIRLQNLRTGEELYADFVFRLWIGRGENTSDERDVLAVQGDSGISRYHCMILQNRNKLFLQDMNSSNHTYLNGNLVTDIVPLENGDIIRMGKTEMRVTYNN